MADRILTNFAEMTGEYNDIPFDDSKSSEVTVRLADVPFTKEADQSLWLSGYLTYTLTVDNQEGEGPMTDIVITDQLDITKFSLVQNSIVVTIAGTVLTLGTDYTVAYTAGGLLTISIINNHSIPAGETATISFRGSKVPETP